jgi:HD-GYP domain-containing protein (c-di-GMP phosphodiesterase class II)
VASCRTPRNFRERDPNHLTDNSNESGWAFYTGLLDALVQVMGSAKGYLFEHGPRMAHLARYLAVRMGLSRTEVSEILFAGILADLGMIGMAEEAWERPTPRLDPQARARVVMHPARSEAIVRSIPYLERLGPLLKHHHERWDGDGYPSGLREKEIPLGAQILRIADTVCALEEWRPHRPDLPADQVRQIVRDSINAEFAPEIAKLYLDLAQKDEIPDFHHKVFQRHLADAASVLLPREVSPLSSEKLLEILAQLIDAKDPYTAGHSRRVAMLSVAVANRLGLDDQFRLSLWAAGYLHDLGKVSVPLRILTKDGPLEPDERRSVEAHSSLGARILESIPTLRHLAPGARYHHERWDGRGYPEGIGGDRIPLVAQILAVSDAYDAMTSRRSYRNSRSHDEAIAEIRSSTGRHFGPAAAAAFLALPEPFFHSVRQPAAERPDPFRKLNLSSLSRVQPVAQASLQL